MIKTSDRYKDKILNAKTNNGVIMNNNVEKFIEQGKIRCIGLSNETPWGLSKFL